MEIAVVLFPRLTALDAIGPYEMLQRLPDTTVTFVGREPGEVRTENGFLGLTVDAPFAELPEPDVVVVPGGIGSRAALRDEELLGWLRRAHAGSRWTTSVCTGSLILAAAGLLDGLSAATHWAAHEPLRALGAVPTDERVVIHPEQRLITAAGVSAGLDMALYLADRLFDPVTAMAMQLQLEYDPQPPFDAGSTHKAGEAVVARARELAVTRD